MVWVLATIIGLITGSFAAYKTTTWVEKNLKGYTYTNTDKVTVVFTRSLFILSCFGFGFSLTMALYYAINH